MAIGDLDIMTFLKSKMRWHQARQRVLAENVANADTPRYVPKDLKALSFKDALRVGKTSSAELVRTHKNHIAAGVSSGGSAFGTSTDNDFEKTPGGNAVVLEDQMMKVAENSFDYQMVSNIYSRSLGLIRTAIGRG